MKYLVFILLGVVVAIESAIFDREVRSAAKQICEPGAKFNDYCNTCACAIDGSEYICTRMACNEDVWNKDGTLKIVPGSNRPARSAPKQICEPGAKFKDYCNTCACAIDGSEYICTRMACNEDVWNKDGTMKIVESQNSIAA